MPATIDKPTAQEFAGDKFDEAAFDRAATDGSVPRNVFIAAGTEPGEGVDYSDLQQAPDGFFHIPDTARRAVSVDQLTLIATHVAREMGYDLEIQTYPGCHGGRVNEAILKKNESLTAKTWMVGRPKAGGGFETVPLSNPAEVNLYDCDKYVIRPATKSKEAAMVEVMCRGEQPPNFFVSHFWGEPILEFLACIFEHSWACLLYTSPSPRD